MKYRFIYLIFLFLLSFKGDCLADSERSKNSCGFTSIKVTAGNKACTVSRQNTDDMELPSLFCDDDNEDDETSSSKKETTFPDKSSVQNHFDALSFFLHSFKKNCCTAASRQMASSSRYITFRVFRL